MRRSSFSPPTRLDVSEKTVMGFGFRQVGVLTVSVPIAFLIVVAWHGGPLALRAMAAVLVAGLGVALAFGRVEGKTLEGWLWDYLAFRRRRRFMIARAARAVPEAREVSIDLGPPEPAPAAIGPGPKPEPEPPPPNPGLPLEQAPVSAPSFLFLVGEAVGLAVIAFLAVWLYDGGANQLRVWWTSAMGGI